MNKPLQSMTKAELIAEIERLKPKGRPKKVAFIEYPLPKKADVPIKAGMDLLKDDLLVVDEEKELAFVYPEVKTVAGKIRIHGYAVRSFKKGQQVRMHHWLDYEPK